MYHSSPLRRDRDKYRRDLKDRVLSKYHNFQIQTFRGSQKTPRGISVSFRTRRKTRFRQIRTINHVR